MRQFHFIPILVSFKFDLFYPDGIKHLFNKSHELLDSVMAIRKSMVSYIIPALTIISALGLSIAIPLTNVLLYAVKNPKDPLGIWNFTRSTFPFNQSTRLSDALFSFILLRSIPFLGQAFGSGITITQIGKGTCKGVLSDSKSVRNPFRSIHACALALLGETVGGLAVFTNLNTLQGERGIVKSLNCEYFKKSRGEIYAECVFDRPVLDKSASEKDFLISRECDAVVTLCNSQEEVVAKVTIRWSMQLKANI